MRQNTRTRIQLSFTEIFYNGAKATQGHMVPGNCDYRNGGITWGTATTPVALEGMCRLGLHREAAAFIRRREFPSIGYMADCGATAVWERWDAIYQKRYYIGYSNMQLGLHRFLQLSPLRRADHGHGAAHPEGRGGRPVRVHQGFRRLLQER